MRKSPGFILITTLSVAAASAQDKPQPPRRENSRCNYTIAGKQYELAADTRICFRSPPPYGDQYSLQQCFPPLQEIAQVKRGDPRCEKYEDRQ
ncbi:hypothetical protein ACVWZ4_000772 [Bradyrhizobium sp. USDA 4472]